MHRAFSTNNFNTVTLDWIQDSLHERTFQNKAPRSRVIAQLDRSDGAVGYLWRLIRRTLEEGEAYVVISLVGVYYNTFQSLVDIDRPVGVIIGVSAALISIITTWLSDIKMGHCTTGWWLSRKFCCLEVSDELEACAEWKNWGGVEPFRWIAYVLFAVSICSRSVVVSLVLTNTITLRLHSLSRPRTWLRTLPHMLQDRVSRRSNASWADSSSTVS